MSWRSWIKLLLPPVLVMGSRRLLRRGNVWSGSYASYDEALSRVAGAGYDSAAILASVKSAMNAVKADHGLFERDGVILDKPQFSWPLVAAVMAAAARNKDPGAGISVLDFGGSLGSHYFQLRPFIADWPVHWVVVEQEAFVKVGLESFADGRLFFSALESLSSEFVPDILILSSVLQYVPEAERVIKELLRFAPELVLLDRTPISVTDRGRWTLQNVPSSIYPAVYPCRVFRVDEIHTWLEPRYSLLAEFSSVVDENFKDLEFRGYLFQKKTVQ